MNENVLQFGFDRYLHAVEEIAASGDWSRFADLFTEDATYCEHAYGDFEGREQIREWIVRTMTTYPGNEMVGFPPSWFVLDPPTNRVICDIRNIMRDPGDGSVHEASNITILTFDDAGNLVREEDIYNPQKFADMVREWSRVADAHGTLSPEGQRMLTALGG
ncbi:MAG: nuclear transport factor 2 family protein [Nocardioidaceae bacterium]|nr:nuclear transport factor 2 family protein [Nocardioidaceae bacterium]